MKLNRRQFLKRTGVVAAGAAAVAVVGAQKLPVKEPIPDMAAWGAAPTDLIYISGNTFTTTSSNDIWVYSHNGELRDEWGHAIAV